MRKVYANDPEALVETLETEVMRDFAETYIEFMIRAHSDYYNSADDYITQLNSILKYFGSDVMVKDVIRDDKGIYFLI